jgi:hypothetical protein
MGRKWATREAESNLFDFGEAQRKRAEAAENLLKQVRQDLEISRGARDLQISVAANARIERNRLRVALQDILDAAEPAGEAWIANRCRQALEGDKGENNAHQKEGAACADCNAAD